jgi:hypothetical protein
LISRPVRQSSEDPGSGAGSWVYGASSPVNDVLAIEEKGFISSCDSVEALHEAGIANTPGLIPSDSNNAFIKETP